VFAEIAGACRQDEEEAPGGARSEPVPLLHSSKSRGDALTARIHATRHSAPDAELA
jgi:hypothetical protein